MNRSIPMLIAFTVVFSTLSALGQSADPNDRLIKLFQRFPEADTDGDGQLTMVEARAYQDTQKNNPAPDTAIVSNDPEPTHADVAYGPHERNVMDLWLATGASPTPVLIYFHGGAFKGGDKDSFRDKVAPYLEAGISVVSANYRYSNHAPYPGPMLDGARVVQFVRSKATQWNIDPDRVALSGGSAGGTMALWIALHDDLADPLAVDVVARESTRVTCVVGHSAPCSVEPGFILEHLGSKNLGKAMYRLLGVDDMEGMTRPAIAELARQASPIRYVSTDDPPLFLEHNPDMTPTPMAEDTPQSKWIHHPKFGLVLKDAYDELGLESYLYYKSQPAAPGEDVRFLLKQFAKPVNERSDQSDTVPSTQPPSHIYKTFGERELQMVMHYPPDWEPGDRRTGILFFSGSHKVQADKNGQLPPLADERAKLGLPVVNLGPGGKHHIPLCDGFAKRGFVCMRVEYRTRGKDGVLPGEDIGDAISAMRWARSHAEVLGIDPNRIVAAGGSSGAYLASSLFAFEDRHPAVGDSPVAARPNAIVLYSPLVDWLEVGIMSDEFLVVLNGDKENGARISPARHWDKDCPPTLVMVGTEEPPFTTVKDFAEKWIKFGAPMELFIAEGREHGFFGKPDWREKTIARTEAFLLTLGLQAQVFASPQITPTPTSPAPTTPPVTANSVNASIQAKLEAMLIKSPEADANKDGVLTMGELRAFKNKPKKTSPNTPAATQLKPGVEQAFSGFVPSRNWDTNQDQKIGNDEFKAPAQLFLNMDLDGDGYLAGPELTKLDSKINLAKTAETTWIVPPEKNYHGVEHKTYLSAAMRTEVGFNLYLPDDYKTSSKRYPVIYHLHGSGGNESVQTDLSAVYHKAIEQGKLPPVIIVFVNGGRRSYYSDRADGKILSETTIIKELIPHIDATYRTIPKKACRVIHGFSMGGFGALKLGMKYPELFGAILSFGGGMAAPDSVHLLFLDHILGGNERLMKANNPSEIALKNKEALVGLPIWLFTGSRDVAREDSLWAHQFMEANHIAHRFEISKDTGHALKKHFEYFGDDIFKMLGEEFKGSPMFMAQGKAG